MTRFLLIAGMLSVALNAADVIPDARKIAWYGKAGVSNGIPDVTTISTTLSSSATLTDINNAIAAAASNSVVKLNPGVYGPYTASIDMLKNGVVLRGSGPTSTIIQFDVASGGQQGHINIGQQIFGDPNTTPPDHSVNWTAGYTQGTTTITLASVTGLSVGKMLMLDQLNDTSLVNPDGPDGCDYCGRSLGARVQVQIQTVTGISGNDVTIFPGIYMTNWNSGLDPEAWWYDDAEYKRIGVEDLALDNLGGVDGHFINFAATYAVDCWFKNVYSTNGYVNHFRPYLSHRIEVRHCYGYGSVSEASQSYGMTCYWASDCLTEDNIFNHVTSPMLNGAASQGNVFIYNYATNQIYFNPNWLIEGTGTHAAHNAYYLFEGNYTPNCWLDFIHGSGSHNTVFRNRFHGYEPGKSLSMFPMAIQATNRYHNAVANILGTTDVHDDYSLDNSEPFSTDKAIYVIGYYSTLSGDIPKYDVTTFDTLIRKGNYNTFTASVPAGEALGGDTYPNSYYYTSKPSYFGVLTWPPYDPANPGDTTTNSMTMVNIPAGYRFVNGNDPPAATGAPNVYGYTARVGTLRSP